MLPNRLSHSRQTLLQNPTPPLRGVFSFVVHSIKKGTAKLSVAPLSNARLNNAEYGQDNKWAYVLDQFNYSYVNINILLKAIEQN